MYATGQATVIKNAEFTVTSKFYSCRENYKNNIFESKISKYINVSSEQLHEDHLE